MATIQAPKADVWSGIFPTVTDEKQSVKFVKKLVALGISSIAYLRFNIPEEVPAFTLVAAHNSQFKVEYPSV